LRIFQIKPSSLWITQVSDFIGEPEWLWRALRPAPPQLGEGLVGKWISWAKKPAQVAL